MKFVKIIALTHSESVPHESALSMTALVPLSSICALWPGAQDIWTTFWPNAKESYRSIQIQRSTVAFLYNTLLSLYMDCEKPNFKKGEPSVGF